MKDFHHFQLSAVDVTNSLFDVAGPLQAVEPRECSDYFEESESAQAQYLGHRSMSPPDNTAMTYHAVNQSGEVLGFISFCIAREDGDGSTRIFVSVEYIYVMQKFRMRSVSTMLLGPLIEELQAVLHGATGTGRRPKICVYSSSQPESPEGVGVLHALEKKLVLIAKAHVDVDLIGRYLEHPSGARQRLQASILPSGQGS